MGPEAYPSIPPAIWSYFQELLVKKPSHPLVVAHQKQGEDRTWQGINELFRITGLNTNLESDRLLRQLGFDEKNLDSNCLPAMFGVMRDINLLHDLGFVKICPLPPQKSRRESDLVAEYDGKLFAVEVFRSSQNRFPGHTLPAYNLESYIIRRYTKKRSQLEATTKIHQCNKALLAVVMDSRTAKALMNTAEWEAFTRDTFEQMASPANTHLLIFTGMKDLSTNKDEFAIYPPLTN